MGKGSCTSTKTENTKDSKLNLDKLRHFAARHNIIKDDTKDRKAKMYKQAFRIRRNETNSTYKTNDISFKIRKRKGRVRNSVSKSTIAMKDSLLSKQESKIRKHRVNNNNPEMSTKYPKNDREVKCVKKQHLSETINQNKKKLYRKDVIHEYQSQLINKEDQNEFCCKTVNCQNNSRITENESVGKRGKSDQCSGKSSTQYKTPPCEYMCSGYNDPVFTPNYEMPTLSSKLKRSNKSYFGRFNFQNIPFVVATSVTPSHNLGLNIQQVLNIMKTRQRIVHDTAPLIIRKISKGTKPMSVLLQQVNAQHEKSFLDPVSQMTRLFYDKGSLDINQEKKSFVSGSRHAEKAQNISKEDNNISAQTYREKGDFHEVYETKQQSPFVANSRNQERVSRMSLNKTNVVCGDQNVSTAGSNNFKEIRDVLINLHDQFEEMNTRYEKLQSESEKSDDETLAKELSTLDKELHVKEEEINTVIGLYKEVLTLKQQMKMLHEKNSLFCIASGSPMEPYKNFLPKSILTGKPHSKGNVYNTTREPSVSMQLTALLRQIQSFHKHLVS